MLNSIFGYQIIGVSYMADKVQARTNKKKRINKKWRKRYGFREVPWKQFYIDTVNKSIYCHPKMVEKIKAEIYMRYKICVGLYIIFDLVFVSMKWNFGGNIEINGIIMLSSDVRNVAIFRE